MDSAHGLEKGTNSLTNELQQVLHCVGKRKHLDEISPWSAIVYAHKVTRWVNEEEPKAEGQKNVQERYDKIVRSRPQEGKAKRPQAGLVDV